MSIAHTYGDGNPFADLGSRDELVEMGKLARRHGLVVTRLDATPTASDFTLRLRSDFKGAAFSGCVAGDGPLMPSTVPRRRQEAAPLNSSPLNSQTPTAPS